MKGQVSIDGCFENDEIIDVIKLLTNAIKESKYKSRFCVSIRFGEE